MKAMIDGPVAQLILDLEARGLLDRTLVVLASEFSRDMMIEGKDSNRVEDQVKVPDKIDELKFYGLHRHFTDAGCVLMFGGGMKRGHLHGETADERPCKTIKDPRRDRRPARHDLPRHGHLPEAGVRRREAAVLRDARRQGRADYEPVRVDSLFSFRLFYFARREHTPGRVQFPSNSEDWPRRLGGAETETEKS